MKIYHGTSYENGQNILKNGWNPKNKVWNVSNDDCVYFYYSSGDKKELGQEDDILIEMALQSAQIAAATNHSNSTSLYVFSIDIDDSELECLKDYSCDNMSNVALEIPVEILKNKKIEYKIYKNVFCPSLSLVYLSFLNINQGYLNVSNLTSSEDSLLSQLKSSNLEGIWAIFYNSIQNAIYG